MRERPVCRQAGRNNKEMCTHNIECFIDLCRRPMRRVSERVNGKIYIGCERNGGASIGNGRRDELKGVEKNI